MEGRKRLWGGRDCGEGEGKEDRREDGEKKERRGERKEEGGDRRERFWRGGGEKKYFLHFFASKFAYSK